uniref:Uncharacterized protein n=1 Tax=Clastoptera arizonana TaxID=38151 RepID=A0A1B6C723_9HEMI
MKLFLVLFLCFNLGYNFIRRIPFVTLDKRIVKGLKEPEPKKGHVLLHDLFVYYDQMDEVSKLIEARNTKGVKLIKTVGKNGPRFLNVSYNLEHLYRTYKWKGDDIDELETSLAGNKYLWNYLKTFKLHI